MSVKTGPVFLYRPGRRCGHSHSHPSDLSELGHVLDQFAEPISLSFQGSSCTLGHWRIDDLCALRDVLWRKWLDHHHSFLLKLPKVASITLSVNCTVGTSTVILRV